MFVKSFFSEPLTIYSASLSLLLPQIASMKIVTLTPNPALDKSTTSPAIVPEKKLRCAPVKIEAGGGGINVSKGLLRLGAESIAVFPVGGNNGKLLQQLVKNEGITTKTLETQGETRESFSVSDEHTGLQYRFTMPGDAMSAAEADALIELTFSLKPDILVASGSLPVGIGDDYYARIARRAKAEGVKIFARLQWRPVSTGIERRCLSFETQSI